MIAALQRSITSRRVFLLLLAALGFTVLPAQLAPAHVVRFPRMVHLRVEPDRLAVAIAHIEHAGVNAARLRGQFDRNGSGELEDFEQEAFAEWLDQRARSGLRLLLDGEAVELESEQRDLVLDRDSRVEEGSGWTLRSVWKLEVGLRPGLHRLAIRDAPANERTIVPIRIDLPSGWTLEEASVEGEATAPVRAGEGTWQAGFSGRGGTVLLDLAVPPRGADLGAGTLGSPDFPGEK